jgi:hypothetical protein
MDDDEAPVRRADAVHLADGAGRRGAKDAVVGAVHHLHELASRNAAAGHDPAVTIVQHAHGASAVRARGPLQPGQQPDDDAAPRQCKARHEQFGHQFTEVQQHRHAGQLERQGREDKCIGRVMNLHQRVRCAAVAAAQLAARQEKEARVLLQVGDCTGALVPRLRQAHDIDAVQGLS